ncbi:MAG TPA: CaiB/BaiF CoA-transferase family protein [Acidimicrobiales bacterium]|nr:CaiB/BaiF CoA-transferase family protein [Acidimicrobiales bacterium]
MAQANGGGPTGLPLSGVLVLEVGSHIAGPFCCTQLADLGADVIKIEAPGAGDSMRGHAPFVNGEAGVFLRVGRNKRSIALDLRQQAGKEAFLRLVDRADVVVENLRPGNMDRLGLGWSVLSVRNPRLVYTAVSGWGRSGPYADDGGLDIMAQAMSGIMSITGPEGGDPAKAGIPVCDLACALYGALATLAALRARDASGEGQLVDVSLFESGVSLTVWEAARYFSTGEVPHALGSAHQSGAPYQAFRAADGYLTAGAPNQGLFERLCKALGLEGLIDDERFANNAARFKNRPALVAAIEEVTAPLPRAEVLATLSAAGVPCSALQHYDEVAADPQLAARGFFKETEHPSAGAVRQLGNPMYFSEQALPMRLPSPRLGEHSAEVLASLGYSPTEFAELLEAGVVAEAGAEVPRAAH